jgi:osmoprotectant transport system permease protein
VDQADESAGIRLMHTFVEALKWLVTGAHWSGFDGIPIRVWQHVELSAVSMALAAALALPTGLYIGHTRRLEFLAVSVANVGRSVPSFAILVILFVIVAKISFSLAFGFAPTVVALTLLAIPPILTNTYVGIQSVDPDTVEAVRGMGMGERDVLRRLEVPMATSLIMAGLRTAAVQVVATATLAALIGGGALGRYIVDGLAQNDQAKLVAGAILVALLALSTEVAFGVAERAFTPRTSSSAPRFRLFHGGPPVTPGEGVPPEGGRAYEGLGEWPRTPTI